MRSASIDAQPDWLRRAAWAVGAVAVALAVIHYRRHGTDLEVYWRAARRFLAALPLYPAADGLRTYRYAPGAALVFAPLAPLPLPVARAAWYLAMIALVVVVLRAVASRAGEAPGAHLLVAWLGVVRPLLEEFHYAQVNLLVLALALAAFAAEDRGRDAMAGALVALAAGLKLAPLVLVLDLAIRRRWRALAGFAAGAMALALAPAITYGASGALRVHLAWLDSMRTSALGLAASAGNQSLLGIALRAGLPGWVGTLASVALVACALAVRAPEPRRSLLLLAMALASPLGWTWNFVLALPAMDLLASAGRRFGWGVAAFGILSLVPLYDVGGPRLERWAFEHSLFGVSMIALFALVARVTAPGFPRSHPPARPAERATAAALER